MRECVGVTNSVLDRLRARGDPMRRPTRNGGIFSLLPLRSVGAKDVRGRLAHGVRSMVDASSLSSRWSAETDLILAMEVAVSNCDWWVRFPSTEDLEERRLRGEEDIVNRKVLDKRA
jgi:hypothetical protein